jgi:hypothetical protein
MSDPDALNNFQPSTIPLDSLQPCDVKGKRRAFVVCSIEGGSDMGAFFPMSEESKARDRSLLIRDHDLVAPVTPEGNRTTL